MVDFFKNNILPPIAIAASQRYRNLKAYVINTLTVTLVSPVIPR